MEEGTNLIGIFLQQGQYKPDKSHYSGHLGKSLVVRDCVVADAVTVEPVSASEFPANREKNREFCKIAASGAPETVNKTVVAGFPIRIP